MVMTEVQRRYSTKEVDAVPILNEFCDAVKAGIQLDNGTTIGLTKRLGGDNQFKWWVLGRKGASSTNPCSFCNVTAEQLRDFELRKKSCIAVTNIFIAIRMEPHLHP